MARMTSNEMMGPFRGHVSPLSGVMRPMGPSEVPQPHFNVKGNAGILHAAPKGASWDVDGLPDISLNPSPGMSP